MYDRLKVSSDEIEELFGESLSWERLDDKKASRIATYTDGSIDDPDSELENVKAWHIGKLLKFREIFGPRLITIANSANEAFS